jgi:AmiR/NasT family two-component response regulator
MDAGVDAYLSKPFDAYQFIQLVESTLEDFKGRLIAKKG